MTQTLPRARSLCRVHSQQALNKVLGLITQARQHDRQTRDHASNAETERQTVGESGKRQMRRTWRSERREEAKDGTTRRRKGRERTHDRMHAYRSGDVCPHRRRKLELTSLDALLPTVSICTTVDGKRTGSYHNHAREREARQTWRWGTRARTHAPSPSPSPSPSNGRYPHSITNVMTPSDHMSTPKP